METSQRTLFFPRVYILPNRLCVIVAYLPETSLLHHVDGGGNARAEATPSSTNADGNMAAGACGSENDGQTAETANRGDPPFPKKGGRARVAC